MKVFIACLGATRQNGCATAGHALYPYCARIAASISRQAEADAAMAKFAVEHNLKAMSPGEERPIIGATRTLNCRIWPRS